MSQSLSSHQELTHIELLRKTVEAMRLSKLILDPYRVKHLRLAATIALSLARNFKILDEDDIVKLQFSAVSHDLMKVSKVEGESSTIVAMGYEIETDLNRYIRLHLDDLHVFDLDTYFNTDIQLHALASGLFTYLSLGIDDPDILYPIFFHSCPILSVYENLTDKQKLLVDILVLSDKLSSGRLKPEQCAIDLDQVLYGVSGDEFNFTQALYLARSIAQGKSTEEQSVLMTEYYYQRWVQQNPMVRLINNGNRKKILKVLKNKRKVIADGKEKGNNASDGSKPMEGDSRKI